MHAATLTRAAGICLTLLLTLPAQAIEPPAAVFRAELDRCLSGLRAELQDGATTQLRYTVTAIEKRGAWYEFDIRSEVFDDPGAPAVREVANHCRANRWTGDTQISG